MPVLVHDSGTWECERNRASILSLQNLMNDVMCATLLRFLPASLILLQVYCQPDSAHIPVQSAVCSIAEVLFLAIFFYLFKMTLHSILLANARFGLRMCPLKPAVSNEAYGLSKLIVLPIVLSFVCVPKTVHVR